MYSVQMHRGVRSGGGGGSRPNENILGGGANLYRFARPPIISTTWKLQDM